jgi:hypothetical protein
MKKALRVLALVGVVSFAASAPALSTEWGLCTYRCINSSATPSVLTFQYYDSYENCMSGGNAVCPTGYTYMYSLWGDGRERS